MKKLVWEVDTIDINETDCIQTCRDKFQGTLLITAVGNKWSCKDASTELKNKD